MPGDPPRIPRIVAGTQNHVLVAPLVRVGLGGIGLNITVLTYEQQGINLWLQLQQELSPDYEVLYFSQKLRKVISHPIELMAAA